MGETVLLTGASGYIAKHVARTLLDAGYRVRGTVRRPERGDQVRDALRPHLADASDLDERLTFAVVDLQDDVGWAEAVTGVDALVHTASPFPLAQPKDESVLVGPAVDGTLRALRAAQGAGVKRVVLTSSTAAIVNTDRRPGRDAHDEVDWTDVDRPGATPYTKSKTLAERSAWDFVADEAPDMALTTINPGFVLGPPLDDDVGGSSMSLVLRLLRGKDAMLPRYGFALVDVRDVAEMHLRALQRPETSGRRYAATSASMWFIEMGATLKAAYPNRKIPTRNAPDLAIRLLGIFDAELRTIVPSLGHIERVSNTRTTTEMEMRFISPEQSLIDTAAHLLAHDLV